MLLEPTCLSCLPAVAKVHTHLQDHRSAPICPRASTPLESRSTAQGLLIRWLGVHLQWQNVRSRSASRTGPVKKPSLCRSSPSSSALVFSQVHFVQGTISAENIQKHEPQGTDFAQTNLPGHPVWTKISLPNPILLLTAYHLCLGVWMNPYSGNKYRDIQISNVIRLINDTKGTQFTPLPGRNGELPSFKHSSFCS